MADPQGKRKKTWGEYFFGSSEENASVLSARQRGMGVAPKAKKISPPEMDSNSSDARPKRGSSNRGQGGPAEASTPKQPVVKQQAEANTKNYPSRGTGAGRYAAPNTGDYASRGSGAKRTAGPPNGNTANYPSRGTVVSGKPTAPSPKPKAKPKTVVKLSASGAGVVKKAQSGNWVAAAAGKKPKNAMQRRMAERYAIGSNGKPL